MLIRVRSALTRRLNAIWYTKNHPGSLLLAPLGWLYGGAAVLRRLAYETGLASAQEFDVPVIVVGNLAVGGTGKTPLVAWLGEHLLARGFKPAIACRGYGGVAKEWPQQVRPDSDPIVVGDEPVLLARRSGCPVAAGPDRVATVAALIDHTGCDVVICDDGLQHFKLARTLEIAVVDGIRRHGNGRCLPAGPLREPISRLASVDIVVANEGAARGEFEYRLVPSGVRRIRDERERRALESFSGQTVHAVCGIGHPDRFFGMVKRSGINVIPHAFYDHYPFRAEDITFDDELPVLMTEKDAVKCRRFARGRHWYVEVQVEPHRLLGDRVIALLQSREEVR